jgi:arylsulfatase A-like enzyme
MLSRRALFLSGLAPAILRAKAKPNVLFLAADDLNDWVEGFGGHPQTITPNLSRLAARGVRFQHAYCNAPLCNPSRASLFTGLRPSSTGIYTNEQTWRDGAPDAPTLGTWFADNGYRSAGCGKLFHNSQPDYSGFHEYLMADSSRVELDAIHAHQPVKAAQNHFDWGPLNIRKEDMGDHLIARFAEEFLQKRHGQPFFLGCGFLKPHLPWHAPKEFFDKFPASGIRLPAYRENDLNDVPKSAIRDAALRDHERVVRSDLWQQAVAAYLATINYCDYNVGRVLDALWQGPNAENTIVVAWGDHGWHLGEKNHWRKFTLWERSCRVPLVIAAPGASKSGVNSPRVAELLDLYPTLLDLCSLPANAKNEGRSLTPLLRNPTAAWDGAAITSHFPQSHSIVDEELYDHKNDPHEWTNLLASGLKRTPLIEQARTRLAARLPQTVVDKPLRSWSQLSREERQKAWGKVRAN